MIATNLKRFIIPGIIIFSFVIIALNFIVTQSSNQNPDDTQTNEEGQELSINSDSVTYPLPASFSKASEVVESDVYLKGLSTGNPKVSSSQASQFVQNSEYVIQYTPSSDSFLIVINSSPFNEQRAKAENEFLDTLNISRQEACTLDVSITTPQWANPNETGTIHRLSFCTGI